MAQSNAAPENNNSVDPEGPVGETQLGSVHRRTSKVTGEIQLSPKEAWTDPEDAAVRDKLSNQREKRQGNQSMWLNRTKRFCHEASVVGLRYIINPTASPFRRSIWVLLLLAGAAFTTFQIQNRISYYLSRPVSLNMRIQHAEEIRFPTVTVCNENRIMYSVAAQNGKKRSAVHFRALSCF